MANNIEVGKLIYKIEADNKAAIASMKQVSAEFDKAAKAMAGLDKQSKNTAKTMKDTTKSFEKMSKQTKTFSLGIKTLAKRFALLYVAKKVITGIKESVVEFANFDKALSGVKAVVDDFNPSIETLAKSLGRTTVFTATQAANAMELLGKAGFDANEILAATPSVLNLAASTGVSLSQAADLASNTLRTFGFEAEEMGRIVDVMAKTVNSSNTNIEQLGFALKFIAPTAASLGVSLEETAATIGVLADSGLKGTLATRALSTSISRMAAPTAKAKDEMKKLGIDFFDAEGKFVGVANAVNQLENAFKDYTPEQKQASLINLAGAEAIQEYSILLRAGSEDIREFTKLLQDSYGAAQRMSEIRLDNLAGDFTKLQSATSGLKIELGEFFSELLSLREGTQLLTDFLNTANSLVTRLNKNFREKEALEQYNDLMADYAKYAKDNTDVNDVLYKSFVNLSDARHEGIKDGKTTAEVLVEQKEKMSLLATEVNIANIAMEKYGIANDDAKKKVTIAVSDIAKSTGETMGAVAKRFDDGSSAIDRFLNKLKKIPGVKQIGEIIQGAIGFRTSIDEAAGFSPANFTKEVTDELQSKLDVLDQKEPSELAKIRAEQEAARLKEEAAAAAAAAAGNGDGGGGNDKTYGSSAKKAETSAEKIAKAFSKMKDDLVDSFQEARTAIGKLEEDIAGLEDKAKELRDEWKKAFNDIRTSTEQSIAGVVVDARTGLADALSEISTISQQEDFNLINIESAERQAQTLADVFLKNKKATEDFAAGTIKESELNKVLAEGALNVKSIEDALSENDVQLQEDYVQALKDEIIARKEKLAIEAEAEATGRINDEDTRAFVDDANKTEISTLIEDETTELKALTDAFNENYAKVQEDLAAANTELDAWKTAQGEIYQKATEFGTEFTTGFVTDAEDRASAEENSATRIIAKVNEMIAAYNRLAAARSRGMGGSVPANNLVSALSGGKIPGFSDGGYTGSGAVGAIAGVVHGGEYVVPANMVRGMPDTINRLENIRRGGGSTSYDNRKSTTVHVTNNGDAGRGFYGDIKYMRFMGNYLNA